MEGAMAGLPSPLDPPPLNKTAIYEFLWVRHTYAKSGYNMVGKSELREMYFQRYYEMDKGIQEI